MIVLALVKGFNGFTQAMIWLTSWVQAPNRECRNAKNERGKIFSVRVDVRNSNLFGF